VGAPGTVLGVTAADGDEATEFPAALVATTEKVYAVPLVKPVTTRGELAPVAVKPPGEDVTVYPVMVLPPSDAGAVKVTLAWAFPAVATGLVGASGSTRLAWPPITLVHVVPLNT
jgi:hypothetical protein